MTEQAYDAETALQRAEYQTLTEDARLRELFGNEEPRVWDSVPRGDDGKPIGGYPYIKIGSVQAVRGEHTDQVQEVELYSTIKVYDEPADGSGKELIKAISGAVVVALTHPDRFDAFAAILAGYGWACVLGESRDARHDDPADGLTEQAVLTFRWELDPLPVI